MRRTRIFATLCAALAVSACATAPAVVAVGDYCAISARPTLVDLCADGVVPQLTPDGWGSCTLPTERDAVTIAAEARKHDDRCGRADD